MQVSYNDFIGVYENVFPKKYCDHIIQIFKNNYDKTLERPWQKAANSFQDTNIGLLPFLDQKTKDVFYDRMDYMVTHYMNKYRQLINEIRGGYEISDFKVQQTKPSEGYHVWHSEFDPTPKYSKRWGVWTLYLNDIEEGGETEFLYQGTRVKPTTGTVCLFPSYYTHSHRGNPPLKNTKYIATGWLLYGHGYVKALSEANERDEKVPKKLPNIN